MTTFRRNSGRIHWAIFAFLLAFAGMLCLLTWYYLVPAGQAVKGADAAERQKLRAVSWLLMSVVLFVLFGGLLLVLRAARLFGSKAPSRPVKTQYIDAWAESGKRMKTPAEDLEEGEGMDGV